MSLGLIIEPDTETYQREQGARLRKQGSNSELMEMLRKMDQGMLEIDSQLKTKLQMRNKFFKVEIKKRDWFMNEAIKKRDLEWKEELEKK